MAAILVQVTVYDEDTRVVQEQFVETYTGSYGYEVERMFRQLGEAVGKKVDPHYEP